MGTFKYTKGEQVIGYGAELDGTTIKADDNDGMFRTEKEALKAYSDFKKLREKVEELKSRLNVS